MNLRPVSYIFVVVSSISLNGMHNFGKPSASHFFLKAAESVLFSEKTEQMADRISKTIDKTQDMFSDVPGYAQLAGWLLQYVSGLKKKLAKEGSLDILRGHLFEIVVARSLVAQEPIIGFGFDICVRTTEGTIASEFDLITVGSVVECKTGRFSKRVRDQLARQLQILKLLQLACKYVDEQGQEACLTENDTYWELQLGDLCVTSRWMRENLSGCTDKCGVCLAWIRSVAHKQLALCTSVKEDKRLSRFLAQHDEVRLIPISACAG